MLKLYNHITNDRAQRLRSLAMPAATLISSLPVFITKEDHRALVASTPASFGDIPPKLCHKETDVSVILDPPLENFPAENGSSGTLYVIERYITFDDAFPRIFDIAASYLVFMSNSSQGFQIPYPAITLHAVSRGESGPSIYCQLDDTVDKSESISPATTDDATEMRELTIVPQNQASCAYFHIYTCKSNLTEFIFSGAYLRSSFNMCCPPSGSQYVRRRAGRCRHLLKPKRCRI